jgi:hypothetical protein
LLWPAVCCHVVGGIQSHCQSTKLMDYRGR